MQNQNADIYIREMQIHDLPQVLELCRQLEHETEITALTKRFTWLAGKSAHGLFSACSRSQTGTILGWMHVSAVFPLERDFAAEVAAIVVDEKARGRGIGSELMRRAEQWAAEHKFPLLVLRSREHREGAHRFYEGLGYSRANKSFGFRKILE